MFSYNTRIIFPFGLTSFLILLIFLLYYKWHYTRMKVFFFFLYPSRNINIVANRSFFKGLLKVCLYGSLICPVLLCAVYKADVSVIGLYNDVFKGRILDMLSLRKKPFSYYIGFFLDIILSC